MNKCADLPAVVSVHHTNSSCAQERHKQESTAYQICLYCSVIASHHTQHQQSFNEFLRHYAETSIQATKKHLQQAKIQEGTCQFLLGTEAIHEYSQASRNAWLRPP